MENQKQLENKNAGGALPAAQQTNSLKSMLGAESTKKRFNEIMGKKAAGFMSSIISAVNGSAQLQKCQPETIIGAAVIAASLDLPIVPGLGFAALIPFWNTKKNCYECQFQVMKKGYIQLALRSGQVSLINSTQVLEGQLVSKNTFTGEYVFQEEKLSDKIIGFVAFVRFINGFEKYKYMTVDELNKHAKRYSQTFKNNQGKWADKIEGGWEQMCDKTVLKLLLASYATLSIEIQKAILFDQATITDDTHEYIDNTPPEPKTIEQLTGDKERMRIIKKINSCKTLEKLEEFQISPEIEGFDVSEQFDARKAEILSGNTSGNQLAVELP